VRGLGAKYLNELIDFLKNCLHKVLQADAELALYVPVIKKQANAEKNCRIEKIWVFYMQQRG